eukprot:TRINITY_DN2859_c0_g1_i1.p1 TRINITY_DN2859_c0_g1~~TRINITY_DN2859_c0_g1_i1.p1  ORF type:complete len:493 (+),score=137.32 TRINITY_DN2859_c0_g1_i1:105-1583(+)
MESKIEETPLKSKIVEAIATPPSEEESFFSEDVRVAVIGNVDSGKSTLIGVLKTNELDDGRGSARSGVFNHPHELERGQTSSISFELIGFDASGEQVLVHGKKHHQDWGEIAKRSKKNMTFIDLCGHEKYLKTTVHGLTGLAPDYGLLVLGANMGVQTMTKEHIAISAALRIPLAVVVTKVDICPEKIFKQTMKQLSKVLKATRKMQYFVRNEEQLNTAIDGMSAGERITPVFVLSNVTGVGMDLFKKFISRITPPKARAGMTSHQKALSEPLEFPIDSVYNVAGVGCVVAGTCLTGSVKKNDVLMLGPGGGSGEEYRPVVVRSIHCHRLDVEETEAGQSAAFALRPSSHMPKGGKHSHVSSTMPLKEFLRKGMFLLDPSITPVPSRCFEAEVVVLHSQTTMTIGYSPVMHCGVIRQAAQLVHVSEMHNRRKKRIDGKVLEEHPDEEHGSVLRSGDRARVVFRFRYRPEHLREGTMILFREGRAKVCAFYIS